MGFLYRGSLFYNNFERKMKRLLIGAIAVIALTSMIYAMNVISSFTASSANEMIDVKWTTNSENNIKEFEVERSLNPNSGFIKIHTEKAEGNPSNYKYTDKTAYKEVAKSLPELQGENTYYYRLKIVSTDGSNQYSDAINVAHSSSSVRKTWGMIKEMMR